MTRSDFYGFDHETDLGPVEVISVEFHYSETRRIQEDPDNGTFFLGGRL